MIKEIENGKKEWQEISLTNGLSNMTHSQPFTIKQYYSDK